MALGPGTPTNGRAAGVWSLGAHGHGASSASHGDVDAKASAASRRLGA